MSYDPPESDPDWCYSHCRSEPGPYFKACGECFHAFPTEADLIADDLAADGGGGTARRAEDIWSCPHCLHDF